ncbi:hypothetical protein QWY79_10360 [Halomonas sabkhae]|uniref:hypothetical protein n=1 Tax=Halomonas sabkhae TaxID=626223 RepID=UPI0025B429F7|nr:hypothetical protein [Halomonas sabkhae]MDN3525665.1 hypothetical protein [Halomonas sabkhae]
MSGSKNQPLVHIKPKLKVGANGAHNKPMVTNEELREAFAKRLRKAIVDSGRRLRGAPVRMHEITGKSANATSKWLKGESIPTQANLQLLCRWLGVREEWLLLGKGAQHLTTEADPAEEHIDPAEQAQELSRFATPRSASALHHIEEAAIAGRLTEDDLILLEQIANRIADQPSKTNNTKTTRERIAENIKDADNDTQGA